MSIRSLEGRLLLESPNVTVGDSKVKPQPSNFNADFTQKVKHRMEVLKQERKRSPTKLPTHFDDQSRDNTSAPQNKSVVDQTRNKTEFEDISKPKKNVYSQLIREVINKMEEMKNRSTANETKNSSENQLETQTTRPRVLEPTLSGSGRINPALEGLTLPQMFFKIARPRSMLYPDLPLPDAGKLGSKYNVRPSAQDPNPQIRLARRPLPGTDPFKYRQSDYFSKANSNKSLASRRKIVLVNAATGLSCNQPELFPKIPKTRTPRCEKNIDLNNIFGFPSANITNFYRPPFPDPQPSGPMVRIPIKIRDPPKKKTEEELKAALSWIGRGVEYIHNGVDAENCDQTDLEVVRRREATFWSEVSYSKFSNNLKKPPTDLNRTNNVTHQPIGQVTTIQSSKTLGIRMPMNSKSLLKPTIPSKTPFYAPSLMAHNTDAKSHNVGAPSFNRNLTENQASTNPVIQAQLERLKQLVASRTMEHNNQMRPVAQRFNDLYNGRTHNSTTNATMNQVAINQTFQPTFLGSGFKRRYPDAIPSTSKEDQHVGINHNPNFSNDSRMMPPPLVPISIFSKRQRTVGPQINPGSHNNGSYNERLHENDSNNGNDQYDKNYDKFIF